ncbi:MAG: hypothetical protein Q7R33_10210 [Nitrosarchaeum sp.]|nr:hypothetical protein [Nitrosarchaeum sp.]
MKTKPEPKNHLSNNHYNCAPGIYTQTMTRKELKETLLATGGWILACGKSWDIKNKHLGAGVYSVFIVERQYK